MASYWQSLKKPLTTNSLVNSKLYSSAIINKGVKSATTSAQGIHVSAKQNYPQAAALPLPNNIDPSETMRFSPQRSRDIASTTMTTNVWNSRAIDVTLDSSIFQAKSASDPHVESYDCFGAVSLNSSMQSNVPSPFNLAGTHNYTHLNMPGGQWSQSSKWMSHDLHSSHYTNLRREVRKNMLNDTVNKKGMGVLKNSACLHGKSSSKTIWMQMSQSNIMKSSFACLTPINQPTVMLCHFNDNSMRRMFSDKKEVSKIDDTKDDSSIEKNAEKEPALTPRKKLQNAIRDYGSTVFIFHIAISLVSLGIFYQLVSSGLDMVAILDYLGLGSTSSTISNNVASGASTFVVAYAIHKVFAPLRISITLVSAPFIVRYLRTKGFLAIKPKKP